MEIKSIERQANINVKLDVARQIITKALQLTEKQAKSLGIAVFVGDEMWETLSEGRRVVTTKDTLESVTWHIEGMAVTILHHKKEN